ncbi:MAG: trypsin-like peptidase domain-containing protein [Kofleriaceae bacterium]
MTSLIQPPASRPPPPLPPPPPRAPITGELAHVPLVDAIEDPRRGRRSWRAVAALTVVMLGIATGVVAVRGGAQTATSPDRGIARVVLTTRSGTGFFIRGPDDAAYVVTAYHVVANGEPIRIERTLPAAGGRSYVEAYPEVEIAGFDAEADLAVLRIHNVGGDRFTPLALADAPVKDAAVQSYGFAASSLAKRSGMISKPGKVLSLVKLAAYDHEAATVIREDVVEGLLISVEIEPGFSGGPTCNERGEVVGINLTKDLAHRGQNGAVSVTALHRLLANIGPPASATPADVTALLAKIETEYLLLPVDRRASVTADDYISASDRPRVEQLVDEIRRLERDTTREPTTKLSGQAMLGIALMRLPGRPLETYTARTIRDQRAACELRERGLDDFFGSHAPPAGDEPPAPPSAARCAVLASRPLIWDLAALALQWEGKPREATVVKLETVDADRHTWRAQVRFAGLDYLVDVWLAGDGGRLRLKLFDPRGLPTGISAGRAIAASALDGTWRRSEPRTKRVINGGIEADVETDETLTISTTTSGTVAANHQLRRRITAAGRRLSCGSGGKLDLGLEQSFTGTLENASIVAVRRSDAKALGADMVRCWRELTYEPDQVAVLKLVGDKLVMYRTDGIAFPEAAEFHR